MAPWYAVFAFLCATQLRPALGQGLPTNGICTTAFQPILTTFFPPAGTTGLSADVGTTNYTITGDLLDQVSTISVLVYFERSNVTLRTDNIVGNSTFVAFNIDDPRLRDREVVNATVLLIPQDPDCITLTVDIKLLGRLRLSFEARSDEARPGTVVFVTSGSCVPGECGDNSTDFDLIIGGLMLESLDTQGTTLRYAGRFPNFQQSIPEASIQIATQYQTFQLGVFFEFELLLPPPIIVMPTSGQRGTFVNIIGNGLIGPGAMVSISRIRLGETDTDIIASNDSVIQIRARSGIPGNFDIRINTTDTFEGVQFDGPYLSLANGWTQLMDGNITEIIPRAAQAGRNISLCGENLLGNGNRVSSIQHGPITQFTLQSLPSPAMPPINASECLTAQIPPNAQGVNETFINITSDTGSTVLSISNFTIATIASITPNRGQTGTIVTIRGQGLLSGYTNTTPSVFLSDTHLTLMTFSNTEIVGRTTTPTSLPPTVINETTGATEAPPEIFGVMGSIEIEVISPFDPNTIFTVSNSTGWQYERPGAIVAATPDFGQFGTVISISGTNLLAYGNSLTHAMIGNMNATVLDGATDTLVRLVVPDSNMIGIVDVFLFSDTGARIRGIETFEYRERGVIVSAEPNQGQRGTLVTITGTDLFGHGNNVTSVLFGGVAAVIDYDSSNDSAIVVEVQENSNTVDARVAIQIISDTSAMVVSSSTFWTYLVQGTVIANQPQEGQVGTRVEITGTNLLGGGTAITEIFLDGVSGTIMSESSTRIVVVMNELLTQRAGFFPSLVYIMSDTGAVVTGGTYTHRASGTINSVSPTRGRRGTIITVVGTGLLGFGTSLDGADIAGMPGMVMSANDSVVVLQAGTGMTNQTGPVVLRSNTGATITSSANFVFDEPGIVSSVTPMMGAEGTGVVVSGSGLLPDNVQLTNVTIGGIPVARVVIASNQVLSVIVGPAPSVNSNMSMIVISASDGSFLDGIFFSFINLVISLPGLSQGQEGTLVNITLPSVSQFDPTNTFKATIDDQAADVVSVITSARIITVRVPRARRLGMFMVDVAVEANGLIARLRNGFTYLPEGVIYMVEPVTGQSGTRVTLQGENLLGGGASITSATVVGQPAMVMQGTNTMVVLQLTTPTQQLSYPLRGDIRLMANTGATVTRLNTFELVTPGNIAQVSPQVGQNRTRVELTGTNLLQGTLTVTSVSLAGVQATVTGTPTNTLVAVEATASAQTQPMPVVIVLSTGATISTGDGLSFSYLIPGQIQSVQPNSGPVGTRVSIRGTNLLQGGTMAREVSMAGVPATINSASDTEIAVTVQAGVPGSGDIVVTSTTGSTLVGTELWTYEDLGSIVSVSPTIGQHGFVVSISGEALLSTSASGYSTCSLAGIPGRITGFFSSTSVQCTAGMNPSSRTNVTGPIEVMTNTGVIITSPTNITFTYYQAYIDSISRSSGNNGTEVAIQGMNLFSHPDNDSFQVARVTFGGVEASIVSSSADEIRVLVGFLDNSTSNDTVRIESSSGSFLELDDAWNYTLPAQIISVDPEFGFPGDIVMLTGENFAETTPRVILGQTQAFDVAVLNNQTIQFRAGVYQGSDMPGTDLPLQIVYPTGETTFSPDVTFMYNETTGSVTSISPPAGQAGAIVTISGTNFPNSSEIMAVRLADVEATIESLQPDELIVRAGTPGTAGVRGSLVIELTSGLVFGLAGVVWEYYPDVTASSVSPMTGQNGTNVTIDLSSIPNLPAVARVNLTSTPATILGMADGVLMVRAGVSNSTPSGRITVELAGSAMISIPNAWSYQMPVSVSQTVPPSGYFNTSVTITGTGFQAGSVDISSVTLAGFETSIISQSNTQLVVRIIQEVSIPTDVVGPVVILANSGATYSSILQRNFTYVAVQVNSISPTNGTRGTEVTLTGMGLLAEGNRIMSATMAGIPATLRSASSAVIVFIAGASPADLPGNITYTLDTGAVVNFPSVWTYREPGEITSISPSTGAMGTIVSISGRNLLGGGSRVQRVVLNSLSTTNILESFDNFVQVVAPGSNTLPPGAGGIQVISDTQAITESNSSAVNFTYLSPGNISYLSPSSGQDGTIVTIRGQRFHNGEGVSRVLLAGVEARIVNANATIVMAEARRPVMAGSFEGPITIISNNSATVLSTQNFTYITEGTIFVVAPARGRNGTIVHMEGENIFGGGSSLQTVTLAGERARIINQSSSMVYVEALLRSGDSTTRVTGDIILESDTNARVRRIDGWTYVQQGVISAIAPEEGQYGTLVSITGQNLLSGGNDISSLQFDDVIFDVQSANDTYITARVGQPTNTSNFTSESISLTSDTGGILYLDYNWNFLSQSSITSLDPPNGFGRDMVVINGTNLLGGGTSIRTVTIDGIDGRVVMATDDEVIIVTGINSNGEERMGNLVLESDTGALTMATWRYDAECTNNTFGTAGNCIPCDEQCNECDGPTDINCTVCTNFAIFLSDNTTFQCVPKCPGLSTRDRICVDACASFQYEQIDTLENTTFCDNCSSLCDPNFGCSGPAASQCRSCLYFRDVVNDTCIESCSIDSFFNSTKDCIPCDPECSGGCFGPSDADCVGCANFQVDPIGLAIPNTVCRSECPDMFFYDATNDLCRSCDSNCVIGCDGPTAFDCMECRSTFIMQNGRQMCTQSCNASSTMQQYYQEQNSAECRACHDNCLPMAGCTGPDSTDCVVCALSQDSDCVSSCSDSTYFIRNSTRECVKCHENCGDGGCNEAGPNNCLSQGSLSAGGGTIAFVIIVILILVAVIVVLVVVLVWGVKTRRFKDKYEPNLEVAENISSGDRYTTRTTALQNTIPLDTIEKPRSTTNPLMSENYTELGPEGREDLGASYGLVDHEKYDLSASQADLYTDMDTIPSSYPQVEEVSASQDVYTDMEPIMLDKGAPAPTLPPKPQEETKKEEKPAPALPPKAELPLPSDADGKPPIPSKPEKALPPGPPPVENEAPELYTDMQGGIKEIFVNSGAEDVYDDVEPTLSSSPPASPAIDDTYEDTSPIVDDTYEDTDTIVANMELYRRTVSSSNVQAPPRVPPARQMISNRQSAPALPSQPIPKKKQHQPPLQRTFSSTSTASNPTSPTSSTFSRPESVISGAGIPEEEQLYDDIGAGEPILPARTQPPTKSQPPKKQSKAKNKKK